MKDWLFYPLVLAFVVAMVYYALSLATYEKIDSSKGLVVEGRFLSTLYASPGTSYSIAGDNVNPFAYAVLSAHVSRENAPPSAGVFLTLGAEDKKVFAKQNLRISIRARKGRANPVESFDIQYFAKDVESGWRTFELTNEFEDYSFDYRAGNANAGENDYLGIWPDVAGEALTMDVKWLKIEVAGPEG